MRKELDMGPHEAICPTHMVRPRQPKPEKKPEQRRNVWLSQPQLQKIIELAEAEDRSFSAMIRRLVQAGLEIYEIRGKR
jgi:hypothetical protein